MEKIHRQAILKNIHQLIYTKNFDKLCDRFVVEGVYSDALIEEVVVSWLNIRRWSKERIMIVKGIIVFMNEFRDAQSRQ
jgi:hypothetical protein